MDSIKKAVTSLKDRIVKTPLERSIIEACSDENWGAANTTLHEIAEKTFSHEDRQVIMKTVWELLKSPSKEWRRIYKVLNLIEQLVKFGSGAVVHEIQDEAFKIRMLQDFSYRESGEDKGIGVRDKSRYLSSILADKNLLEEEREKAKKTWSKFTGISSDNVYGGFTENRRKNDSYDPYVPKDYRNESDYRNNSYNSEPRYEKRETFNKESDVDIFKPPEVKVQKTENKPSIWDQEPGKIPPPKILKPQSSNPVSVNSIFDPPEVKTVPRSSEFSSFQSANVPVFPSQSIFNTTENKNIFETVLPASFPQINPISSSSFNSSNSLLQINISPNPPNKPSFETSNLSTNLNNLVFPTIPNNNYSGVSPSIQPKPAFNQNSSNLTSSTGFTSNNLGLQSNNLGLTSNLYQNPSYSYNNSFVPDIYIAPSSNKPTNLSNVKPDLPNSKSQSKIHFNIGNNSEATIDQLKTFGKSGFTEFQAPPPPKPPVVDLESKLINLDNLELGQPKIKEVIKSRW